MAELLCAAPRFALLGWHVVQVMVIDLDGLQGGHIHERGFLLNVVLLYIRLLGGGKDRPIVRLSMAEFGRLGLLGSHQI